MKKISFLLLIFIMPILLILIVLNKKTIILDDKIVLNKVKQQFSKIHPIQDAWIHVKPQKKDLSTSALTYIGGFTYIQDDKPIYYTFTADAITGKIINYHSFL